MTRQAEALAWIRWIRRTIIRALSLEKKHDKMALSLRIVQATIFISHRMKMYNTGGCQQDQGHTSAAGLSAGGSKITGCKAP